MMRIVDPTVYCNKIMFADMVLPMRRRHARRRCCRNARQDLSMLQGLNLQDLYRFHSRLRMNPYRSSRRATR